MAMRLRWADLQTVSLGKGLSLAGFDEKMFLELCVLCGCDYLDSIKNLGLKTALKLMARLKDGQRVSSTCAPPRSTKASRCPTVTRRASATRASRSTTSASGRPRSAASSTCAAAPDRLRRRRRRRPLLWPQPVARRRRHVCAGRAVPAQDPFSKAAAAGAAAAAAAAAAQAPANPFLFQRRGGADGTAPSPSRRGSRSAGTSAGSRRVRVGRATRRRRG